MKKKIIIRSLLGFPIGIAIGYLITILTSLVWAKGYYPPCVPELISVMGNEINAVILQTVLCKILGTGFAANSIIWEMYNWSLVKQTGIYFSIISVIMLPIAYLAYWMEHSVAGFFIYFGIFVLIFAVIWIRLRLYQPSIYSKTALRASLKPWEVFLYLFRQPDKCHAFAVLFYGFFCPLPRNR